MTVNGTIEFACLEATQPIGAFYVGVMNAADVLAISYADIRRIEQRDFERVIGIQRELSTPRVRDLREYVTHIDATFPTGIILAIEGKNAEYDPKKQVMRVRREEKVAQIIDGQHRIAGLEGFDGDFQLNVTVFVDMDLQDRAMTFATINLAQTKVNRSLVYDLYSFQKSRSPQKTCHQIARLLNSEEGSPLERRIKILGKATGEAYQFITQAAFVESLIGYISSNASRDRDALRRKKKLPQAPEKDRSKLIFRELFAAEQDAEIADIVWSLFEGVAIRWPDAWNSDERGLVLNRTTGFKAVMRFLGPLYRSYDVHTGFTTDMALKVLQRVRLKDTDFTTENYKPGSTGESALYRELVAQSQV